MSCESQMVIIFFYKKLVHKKLSTTGSQNLRYFSSTPRSSLVIITVEQTIYEQERDLYKLYIDIKT